MTRGDTHGTRNRESLTSWERDSQGRQRKPGSHLLRHGQTQPTCPMPEPYHRGCYTTSGWSEQGWRKSFKPSGKVQGHWDSKRQHRMEGWREACP